MRLRICMYVCMHVRTYVECLLPFLLDQQHVHMHVFVYVFMCLYLCVYLSLAFETSKFSLAASKDNVFLCMYRIDAVICFTAATYACPCVYVCMHIESALSSALDEQHACAHL